MECIICDTDFEARRMTAKYCSNRCRQWSYRNGSAADSVTVSDSVTPPSVIPDKIILDPACYSQDYNIERHVRPPLTKTEQVKGRFKEVN